MARSYHCAAGSFGRRLMTYMIPQPATPRGSFTLVGATSPECPRQFGSAAVSGTDLAALTGIPPGSLTGWEPGLTR